MKKILPIILLSIITGIPISALDLSLGGRINFNLNTLSADSNIYANKGFIFGGGITSVICIEITNDFALQPEIAFNCQNGMYFSFNEKEQTISFSTIDIPVLIKGQFQTGPSILGVMLGPQFSFIIGDIILKNNTSIIRISVSEAKINTFLFSFITGIDYSIPAGPGLIVLDVRFMMDFTSITDSGRNTGNRIRLSPSIGYIIDL